MCVSFYVGSLDLSLLCSDINWIQVKIELLNLLEFLKAIQENECLYIYIYIGAL